jgi:hypothetical protein
MFDINDETTTRVKKDATPVDRLPTTDIPERTEPDNPLDNDKNRQLHGRLLSYYRQELDRQAENRHQQAVDEDYYDHIQWTEEEAAALKERGQAPIAYNVIFQSINWILGSEKRGRTDFKILPRGKEDAKPAEVKTKFLKYLSDVNRTPFHRSRAFEDQVKVGIGWLETAVQDEDDGEPIYDRYESWRNMLWDSASTELDGSDMRYIFRTKWVDVDIAKEYFPERAAFIEQAATSVTLLGASSMTDGDDAMDYAEADRDSNSTSGQSGINLHQRKRVRVIEAWYRTPMKVKRLRGGNFGGQVLDENDPRHAEEVATGRAAIISKTMMVVRCALFTGTGLLYEGASPYRHNKFPFIPLWGYRRGRDGLPFGVIRGLRDIQDNINKRASKALHILSTNKVIMDEDALPEGMTLDEFADEIARPDAIIVKRQGKNIDINVDRELAPAHLEQMSRDINMIQQTSGVTDELLGRTTNAVSGVAIERRQEQGSLATSKLFDNLRLAVQMQGEIQLSLIEQFVTEQKQFRVTNERGTPEFIQMNDGLPENDITRTKADFVVSEADHRATMRQAATEQFTEMLTKMPPQVAMVMLDLVVDGMDIPNREEMVKRIRAVNGQRDPDATEMTPEEMQKAQAQAEQAQMQARAAMAEIALREGQAAKAHADAKRAEAGMLGDTMNAMIGSMTAATQIVQMPTIAKVADGLLAEAGWPAAEIAAQGIPVQPVAPAQQPPMQPEAPVPGGEVIQPQ